MYSKRWHLFSREICVFAVCLTITLLNPLLPISECPLPFEVHRHSPMEMSEAIAQMQISVSQLEPGVGTHTSQDPICEEPLYISNSGLNVSAFCLLGQPGAAECSGFFSRSSVPEVTQRQTGAKEPAPRSILSQTKGNDAEEDAEEEPEEEPEILD